jgi:hypothetical protein
MPKRRIDADRTRRFPHLTFAIRMIEKAPPIDKPPKKKAGKHRKKK